MNEVMNILKNSDLKISFIGISLSGLSTIDSAIAVIDSKMNIISLEKMFSINDIKYFLENLAGKKNSIITVSIPENEIMLNSKWKYNSRTYDTVNFEKKIKNIEGWTNRYSFRGCDYFRELNNKGLDIFRFDVNNMKKVFGNCYAYREHTPIDCKSLQDTLRMKYGMRELPVNMLPVAQLEAILGAILSKFLYIKHPEFEPQIIGEYEGLPIIGI